jgi:hypothetical protein
MITYKIVEKTKDGKYKFLFHRRKTPIEIGRPIIAEKKMGYESYNKDGTKREYLTGIHVIETEELCIKYLRRFKKQTDKTILICKAEGCSPKPRGNPGVLLADEIIPIKELGADVLYNQGETVVATWGYNNITKRPFSFLYDFGYYTKYGCVVYNHGERNMQDSSAFKMFQIRLATKEDMKKYYWGS